jgi:glycerol-3-phosphate dehydrogenase
VIHVTRVRSQPFISIFGGKLTAYRAQARRVVDHLTRTPSRTDQEPLPGAFDGDPESFERSEAAGARNRLGLEEDVARHLVRRYGSEWGTVADLTRGRLDLREPLAPGRPEIAAEVVHAVRREMAVTLTDVILGRLTLGRAPDQGLSCAERVADLVATELGWDARRHAEEIDRFAEALRERRPPA